MLFRMDSAAWCPPAALPHQVVAGDWALTALLAAVVWMTVGVVVGCVDYWSLDDDEVAGADPLDSSAWVSLAWMYLVVWPMVLRAMYWEHCADRYFRGYRSTGGQECDE